MLLHWDALLIFCCSTISIAHASSTTETNRRAESATLSSFVVQQGPWNIPDLDSSPFYKGASDIDNIIPSDSVPEPDLAPSAGDGSFYSVNSRFVDFDAAESGFIPPDPHGAAGRDMLVAIINSNIIARTKAGVLIFKSTLKDFFSQGLGRDLTAAAVFDPKILYDASEDRFVAVALWGSGALSFVFLAVSKDGSPATPTPTDWKFGEINSLINGNWADYPGFGLCAQAIYITNNMYNATRYYQETRLWIVAKAPFYNSGAVQQPAGSPFSLSAISAGFAFTSQPAATTGLVGAYLLSFGSSGFYYTNSSIAALMAFKVSDPIGTPTIAHQFVNIGPLGTLADTSSALPNAPQRNSTQLIDTGNKRIYQALRVKNTIWGVMNVKLQEKATAYWVKIDASNPTIQFLDKGPILIDNISPGASTYYPSIAVNEDGIVAFGFAASGPNLFAGAYVTVRDDVFDPVSTVRDSQVASPGTSTYASLDRFGRNRWGDYTATVVDPVDFSCFWAYNEYAAGTATWITAWHRFCVAGRPSATPSTKPSATPLKSPTVSPPVFRPVTQPVAAPVAPPAVVSPATVPIAITVDPPTTQSCSDWFFLFWPICWLISVVITLLRAISLL